MKRFLMAITLVAVLSVTALAGDMPGGGKSAPGDMPGGGRSITTSETPIGEMPGGGSATSSETESSLIVTVLLTIITVVG